MENYHWDRRVGWHICRTTRIQQVFLAPLALVRRALHPALHPALHCTTLHTLLHFPAFPHSPSPVSLLPQCPSSPNMQIPRQLVPLSPLYPIASSCESPFPHVFSWLSQLAFSPHINSPSPPLFPSPIILLLLCYYFVAGLLLPYTFRQYGL